jgi:hypothetical protein
MRGLILAVAAAAGLMASGAASAATSLDLGAAGGFALVDLASGKTLGLNSGPLAGNVLLGNHVNAAFAGGGGGHITGVLDYDSTVTGTNTFTQLATAPTTATVSTAFTTDAFNAANGVASYIEGLAATQSFGTINSTTTINGNGGLNVIHLGSLQNALLTLHGGANDMFVFDVSGTFATNQHMALTGGVTADHVIFDFTGASGNVFQTSGGDLLYGTFLATHGGSFQFSNLVLTGALINTGGNVQFVSGSELPTFSSFKAPVPEPAAWALMVLGMGALGAELRRRRNDGLGRAVAG